MNLSYKAEEGNRRIFRRTGHRKFAIKSAYNIFEEGCWNNSQYEWDLVWKCKSQHKILYFYQLVLINRLLINELLEEQVI